MKHSLRLALFAFALLASGVTLAQDLFDGSAAAEDGNGAQTSAEMCHNACERDYAICNDEGSAGRDTLDGRTSSDIRGYRCGKDLTDCLNKCRGL